MVMSSRVCIIHLTCTGACNILLTLMCLVTCSTTKMPKWKAEYQDILAHLFFHLVEWKGIPVMNPRWTFQLKLHLFFLIYFILSFPILLVCILYLVLFLYHVSPLPLVPLVPIHCPQKDPSTSFIISLPHFLCSSQDLRQQWLKQ